MAEVDEYARDTERRKNLEKLMFMILNLIAGTELGREGGWR
jgi:hypothetical protein